MNAAKSPGKTGNAERSDAVEGPPERQDGDDKCAIVRHGTDGKTNGRSDAEPFVVAGLAEPLTIDFVVDLNEPRIDVRADLERAIALAEGVAALATGSARVLAQELLAALESMRQPTAVVDLAQIRQLRRV